MWREFGFWIGASIMVSIIFKHEELSTNALILWSLIVVINFLFAGINHLENSIKEN